MMKGREVLSKGREVYTKDNIVKLLVSIRETKKNIDGLKTNKERLVVKNNILLDTLEKTKYASISVEQEYAEYKEFISYIIDINYYIKKYRYTSPSVDLSEIHAKFSKISNPKICISTIKTQPNIATDIQKSNSYRDRLNYLIKVNTRELDMYNNELYLKKLDNLYDQLSKIDIEIDIEKTARYVIYEQIINEIIDGKIVRSVPFYNIKNQTIRTNIKSDIKCTKQQIRLNYSKQKELKKCIIEYTNVIENDIYNIHEIIFNNILDHVFEHFQIEKYTILIDSLNKKHNTLTTKLANIDKQINELSNEFKQLFNQMADILQRINISQIHIWNLAVTEFNTRPL